LHRGFLYGKNRFYENDDLFVNIPFYFLTSANVYNANVFLVYIELEENSK